MPLLCLEFFFFFFLSYTLSCQNGVIYLLQPPKPQTQHSQHPRASYHIKWAQPLARPIGYCRRDPWFVEAGEPLKISTHQTLCKQCCGLSSLLIEPSQKLFLQATSPFIFEQTLNLNWSFLGTDPHSFWTVFGGMKGYQFWFFFFFKSLKFPPPRTDDHSSP